jgi:hypothetical protein
MQMKRDSSRSSYEDDGQPTRSVPVCVPVTKDDGAAWLQVQKATREVSHVPILSDWGLDLLKQGVGHIAKTVLVEPSYVCKDHCDLVSHYYSRKFNPNSGICSRLHFFSRHFGGLTDIVCADPNELGYMGYSVVRPVPHRCIGRTMIDPSLLDIGYQQDLFCLSAETCVHLGGLPLRTRGYPYMSQDNEAMVCAHAALWGVCRYYSERFKIYAELHPYDLINLTTAQEGRACPRHGMVYQDYSKILSDFGTYPVIVRLKNGPWDKNPQNPTAWRNLCAYVESGFPVLASLASPKADSGHVVAVVGHTVDYSLGTPDERGIINHTDFFRELVVVDDNAFPYQRLGKMGAPDNYGDTFTDAPFGRESIHTAVCPLPEKVFLTAEVIRPLMEGYLSKIWPEVQKTGEGPWVKRLFLATCHSFQAHQLKSAKARALSYSDNLDFILTLTRLPHFVWGLQVGPKSLYVNKHMCTTEIVVDATSGPYDPDAVLYARIGNSLLFPNGKSYTVAHANPEFPLFRHNLGR